MKLETKWNIGDDVWGVCQDYITKNVACPDCNGHGGALIPGTKVRVECQECNGDGQVEITLQPYRVIHGTVETVEATAKYHSCQNSYRIGWRNSIDEEWIFSTEREANDALTKLNERIAKRQAEYDAECAAST
jgi:RecJ-like exonuclease